jgi:signal transduction histidine kinase
MPEIEPRDTSHSPAMRASLGQTLLLALWLFLSVALVVIFLYLQRVDALELSLLAAVLLVPSLVVCIFLGHARFRIRREVERRYIEQIDHLAELEEKIRQRTSELDERNRQLSAEVKERLAAEDRLKQSNDLLSGIIGSIDGIIYVVDFDSHEILFANNYLRKLFGFDPVGRKCYQFIHSSGDEPCMFCNNHRLLTAEQLPAGPYEWEYQNPFNKKWYRAKDQAIRWADGRYVKLEIAIDVTEQKSLQHFLQEARKQAELATKIRSRFVALVAHDLKSPFYSITQMLRRILEREHFSHDIHRKFLENIVINGERMLQMIDNLLSMNRLETGGLKLEKSFFNIFEMTNEVIHNFSHLASEKGVRLVNSIPPAGKVYGDRYLYFVVLNNLVSNGIKFSDQGGRIELSTPEPDHPMTVAVSDEGQGMDRQYLQNLFRSDVKTSSPGTSGEKGSGLGLVFCQEIIRAHHGIIEVSSKPGVGTTFFVRLPECSRLDYRKKQQAQPAL